MPYNEFDCVRLLRPFEGEDAYVGGHYVVPCGEVGTIVNGLYAGKYEVEFLLTNANGLFSVVMEVAEDLLAPYGENAS